VLFSLPFFLLPGESNFFWACPWFVGSFALGMAGAVIGFSPQYRDSALRTRAPWGILTALTFVALVAICVTGRADAWGYPIVDLVVSLLAFFMINACVQQASGPSSAGGWLTKCLAARPLVYMGGFSYSLYLIQHPILRFTEKAFNRLPLSYDANIALHLLVVTPLVVGIAWMFAELFERPFTTGAVLLPALQRRLRVARPESA
jgi:peptidoglycan/LPS O-acetylase OafA/YrhL